MAAAPTPNSPVTKAYITVVIASGDDTVSWSDPGGCSSDYNIYKAITPSGNDSETSHIHLVSAASGSTQATLAISHSEDGQHPAVEVELYCGTYDAASSQNLLISSTQLSMGINIREGTYSSAPLTALTISSGMLSPDFDRGLRRYSAEVPSDVEVITLDPTVLTGYQTDFFKNPGSYTVIVCSGPWRLNCVYSYGDGTTTGIVLSDADTDTEGFQINLDPGENRLGIGVHKGPVAAGSAKTYRLTITRAANTPATGQPTINGTAQVGEVLEVDTSGIADVDGLANVTFSYQWLSSRDTEIGGATSSTYTLQPSDEGKAISVQVSFTDDAGNGETLTSAATDAVAAAPTPNTPATGAPTISGTAQVGETLTADTSGIGDADGLTNVTYGYQWLSSRDTEIGGATSSTYTLQASDASKIVKVRVTFTDDAGNNETLTSAPTAAVAAPAQADSEDEPSELSYLTVVVTEDDSDPDNVVTTFTITWNDAEDCSASYNAYLDGVVGDPIHLGSAASEGEQIAASLTNVSAESIGFDAKLYCGTIGSGRLVDSLMIPEYSRSFDTVPISRAYLPKPGTYSTEPGLTVLTVSSGTLTPAFHSQTLNYTVPDVANADGRITLTTTTKADYYTVAFIPGSLYFYISSCSHGGQQTSVSYQDDTGNPLYPMTDADANTPGFQMELDEGENVFKIRVWPNCENGHLYKLTVTRAANAPANTPATGAPTISGTARVGETLTAATSGIADADGLTGATFSYQWLSSRDTEIQGATGAAYILVPGDAGKTIKVKVSFTDDAGYEESLTSEATAVVAANVNTPATGAPTISGTAQVEETLTADTSGISDVDGLDNATFTYQWLADDSDISGATNSTYALTNSEKGKTIKVRVSFTDDAGSEEAVTSESTAVVVAPPPPPPNSVRAVSQKNSSVELTWEAPDDATVTGYRIERRQSGGSGNVGRSVGGSGAAQTLVEDTGSADTGYTDATTQEGMEYAYRVSAINEVGVGEASAWVSTAVVWSATMTAGWVYQGYGYYSTATKRAGSLSPASFEMDGTTYTVTMMETNGWMYIGLDRELPFDFVLELDGSQFASIDASFNSYSYGNIYRWTGADLRWRDGDTIRVQMLRAVENVRDEEAANSPATGLPTINGTAQVGETLTADTSGIADEDGLSNATFTYQWLADDADISGATGSTYTLADADSSKAIKVRVSFTDDAGNEETLTSAATAAVTGAEPAERPSTPTGLSGDTYHDRVVLSWDDPGDASIDGYIILRRQHDTHAQGQFSTLVADTGTAETTYTDDTVTPEKRYTYRIKAINEHGESERSRWFHTDTPAAPSTPATGAPTITGTARVGETLSADTSNISDPDGLDNATFSYQWLADDAEITGATNATYTLADAEESKAIKVRASFTDDAGNPETLTSEATGAVVARPNNPATGAPTINGTAQVGETLTADTSDIADEDGLDNATFSYQWLADDDELAGATNSTYTLVDADEGKTVKVRVSFTDDADNDETLTSTATRINTPATGAPTISGTAQVHEILTADASSIADTDGLTAPSFVYQWSASDGSGKNFLLLVSFEDPTYVVQSRDAGMNIWVEAQFADDTGNRERLRSEETGVVTAAANPTVPEAPEHRRVHPGVAVSPKGSGELEVSWSRPGYPYGDGGSVITGGKVQWKEASGSWDTKADVSESVVLGNCTVCQHSITGLTNGVAYTVRVFATNALGDSPPSDELTSMPTDGMALTLSGITRTNYPEDEVDWVAAYTATGSETAIAWSLSGDDSDDFSIVTGGTNGSLRFDSRPNYQSPTDADRDNQYQVTVHASDGTQVRALQVTVVVNSRGLPIINGSAQVGQTLTADMSGITDVGGLHSPDFSYQWLSSRDTEIDGATSSTYVLQESDAGKTIKVRVSFTDDVGNEETLTSAATGPVLREPVSGDGPPGAPRNLTVTAGDREITLSWEPPEDNGNPPATRYRIERRMDGKDYNESHWGIARKTTYTKTHLANGVTYIFRVKAENGSGNDYGPYGPPSEEVSGTPTSGLAVDLATPVLSNTKTLHHGMVQLDWEDIEDAGWYVVQYYHVKSGEWLDLPAAGVDIAFHGSSAVVSNLHGLSWLRVRAVSCAGESEWSQIEQLFGTKESDWEDVPVPEVAEGDEISPCPVILGTPVLSGPETLHHGMVRLDWQDIENAGWYVVQYYHVKSGEWLDLPAAGVDIAFHGSSAVVSNLHGLSWLRVRAVSCAGESEWSQIEQLFGTKESDWEDVPVPEVAEGDEIEPCPEDGGTPDNSPATGAPTISGTAQVGETLSADTSGIADADGFTNGAFTYQWVADDVDISGATGSTYTLTDSEEGQAIKVEVSFTDDAGNGETLTSAATDAVSAAPTPNSPATGAPTISGTAQVGETLTADTSGVSDADGLTNPAFTYQWLADDSEIAGTTSLTYTLADTDKGNVIKVRVSFTDDAGNEETLTSEATDAVAAAPTPNSPATGATTISGTAQVGETLTANTSSIADSDGLGNVQYEYQWLADDSDISGATNATYPLVAAEEGNVIKVRVSFTDDAGNEETLTSDATDAVAAAPAANSPATGAPAISGTAQVGQTLTANTSEVADADGLSSVQYEYQWLADDSDISGATNTTYTLVAVDEGKAVTVRVRFTDDAGHDETLTSPATDAVAAAEPAEPPDKPRGLSATATHDSVTLTWEDPGDDSITGYVILRRVRVNDQGGEFSVLVPDTGSAATTYADDTVAASTTYTYRIKATNGAGTSERSRWFHIDIPAAPVPDKPTGLSATATHDQVVLTWDDPGDDSVTGYVVLRRHRYDDPKGHFDELVADTGTADTTYTDDTVAAGTSYTYRIKAINGAGPGERSRWFHIDTPAAP